MRLNCLKTAIGAVAIIAQFSFTTGVGEGNTSKTQRLINHAKWQATQEVTYDGSYRKIDYPNGDVPANIGVCTDVVIRAYRAIGIDLQLFIHEDMLLNKSIYDKKRKTNRLDRSIDHRRCPNIRTFLDRQGADLPVTKNGSDYLPGDLVFWDIAAGHVGIVIDQKVENTNRYYVVHNIGWGPYVSDFLFAADIVDHYRWYP